MNILFNRKILFSLLLSSSLLIQGAYAQNDNDSLAEISGTLGIQPTSSLSTTKLDIHVGGSVTVGDSNTTNGNGVLYIKDGENDTESTIAGTLKINADGLVLNEETIKCTTGTLKNKDKTVPAKGGLFANQGTIEVGATATLICQQFSTEMGKEQDGGIMNGASPVDATKTPTFSYDADDHTINKDTVSSGDPYTGNSGTIIFTPGAICNNGGEGTPGSGAIDGGYINLMKYVKIKYSSSTYLLDFENNANNELNSGNPTANNNTTILQINLKNAEIKLFDGNVDGKDGTLELSPLKLVDFGSSDTETTKSKFSMQDMFKNLTFENCRCEIPDDPDGSSSVQYKASVWYKLNTSKNGYDSKLLSEAQVTLDSDNIQGDNPDQFTPSHIIAFDSNKRNKITTGGSSGDSNFDVVKELFADNDSIAISTSDSSTTHKKIYHEIGTKDPTNGNKYILWTKTGNVYYNSGALQKPQPGDGLILWSTNGGQDGSKKTFSYLFNTYMGLNCYVDLADVTGVVSDSISKDDNKLDLVLETPIGHSAGAKYSYSIFMQLANKIKVSSSTLETDNIVIQNQTSDFATTPILKDFDGTLELVMKNPWIHTSANPTYTGTLSRDLPSTPSDAQRTTRIVQEYAGPMFTKYKIGNPGVGNNVAVSDSTSREILEYEVNCHCGNTDNENFNSTNTGNATKEFSTGSTNTEFVLDKFIVGDNDNVLVRSEDDNTSKFTRIKTQQFIVGSSTKSNTTFELHGHITVKNLTGKDFT